MGWARHVLILIAIFSSWSTIAQEQQEYWQAQEFITVTPPEDMDLTFQIIEDFDAEQPVLIGWKGEDFLYTFNFRPIKAENVYFEAMWKELIKEKKKANNNKKPDILHKSSYVTDSGLNAEYQVMMYLENGEPESVVFHVILAEKISYLVAAYAASPDALQQTMEDSVRILKTANITK